MDSQTDQQDRNIYASSPLGEDIITFYFIIFNVNVFLVAVCIFLKSCMEAFFLGFRFYFLLKKFQVV